jgi:hypothetical protein
MRRSLLPLLFLAHGACDDTTNPDEQNEGEVITTAILTFTPSAGGDAVEFTWTDPENDGSPVIDPIAIAPGAYDVSVAFWNDLADPAEEITPEVLEEGDHHQVFFTGSGVMGPATAEVESAVLEHAYADEDANGDPIGLENTVTADVGTAELIVTLRHLPPENDVAVKTSTTAAEVATGGFDAIGGENDFQGTFDVSVAAPAR